MNTHTCKLCGSPRVEAFQKPDAKAAGATLSLLTCQDCSLVQQADIPDTESLKAYYSHHYRADYKATFTPKMKHVRRAGTAALERLSFLRSLLRAHYQPECIDIGAGGGEFVYLARRMNIAARGIEPNIGYSEFARSAYGVRIDTADIDSLAPQSADIVTMFHVLEHLPEPLGAARRIHSALRPGGLLFIEVPNILQKDASPHNIYFGAHLFYFSIDTLCALLSPHFELVKQDAEGNIKAIFRRLDNPAPVALPTADATAHALKRLREKGWVEYLTQGGATMRLLRRMARNIAELSVRHQNPRQILDTLFERMPAVTRPAPPQPKWLPWSVAGAIALLAVGLLT